MNQTQPSNSKEHVEKNEMQQSQELPNNTKRELSPKVLPIIQSNSDIIEKLPLIHSENNIITSTTTLRKLTSVKMSTPLDKNSEIHISKSKVNLYLEYIWKIDIPKNKMNESFYEVKRIKCRRNKEFFSAFIYVYYPSSICGSALFVFQTNDGFSIEGFNTLIVQLFNELQMDDGNTNIQTQMQNESDSNKPHISGNNSSENSSQNKSNTNCNGSNYSQETVSSKNSKNDQNENTQNNIDNNNNTFANRIIKKNKKIFYTNSEQNDDDTNEISYDININFYVSSKRIAQNSYKNVQNNKCILMQLNLPSSNYTETPFLTFIIDQKTIKNSAPSSLYNGLINEGMTCYMNSMIQSYNVLGYFKRGIFSIPNDPNEENSLSYSLQRLFYDLTFEKEPASTNQLIQSFGWTRDDIFIQHDVQEFNLMLSDLMEKKMKGKKSDEVFKFLFEGKISNEIKCIEYNYTSVKEEKFNDIQLNVKGCNNIYDSFRKFTEEEILDGDDKYLVEGHGKEKAKKQIQFLSLPPVFILQLKRFEYNPRRDQMDKINDYYTFDDHINMKNFVKQDPSKQNDDTSYYDYKLLSVVVHKGNVYGGHYYAYIRPDVQNDKWYCFNDENVHEVDLYEVFDINFGGNLNIVKYKPETNTISAFCPKSDLSAYILIYIQTNKAMMILKPLEINEVPNEICERIMIDKKRERMKELLKERKVKNMDVYFCSKETLAHYKGLGISRGNCDVYQEDEPIMIDDYNYNTKINIPRKTTILELYGILSSHFLFIDIKMFSLYLIIFPNQKKILNRYDYTMSFLDIQKVGDKQIGKLCENLGDNTKAKKRLMIYIDTSNIKNYIPLKKCNIIENECDIDDELGQNEIRIELDKDNFIWKPKSNPYEFIPYIPQYINYLHNQKKLLIFKKFSIDKKNIYIDKIMNIEIDHLYQILPYYINQIIQYEKEVYNFYLQCFDIIDANNFGIIYLLEKPNEELETINSKETYNDKIIKYTIDNVNINDNNIIKVIYNFSSLFRNYAKTDSFVIIPYIYRIEEKTPYYYTELLVCIEKYKYELHLPYVYQSPNEKQIQLGSKSFSLKDTESIVKNKIFSFLSKKQLLDLIYEDHESKKCYIFLYNKNKIISYEEFINDDYITSNNIIPISKLITKKYDDIQNEVPLLTYSGNIKPPYDIIFTISTIFSPNEIKNQSQYCDPNTKEISPQADSLLLMVTLLDLSYNELADVDIYLNQSNINITVKDFINFLRGNLIRRFYSDPNSEYTMHFTQRRGFGLLIIEPDDHIKSVLEKKRASGSGWRVCIKQQISINALGYKKEEYSFKIKVVFKIDEGNSLYDPILICTSNEAKVGEVKKLIMDKIENIQKIKENKDIEIGDWKKIKLYTYSFNQWGIQRGGIILNEKDDEPLKDLYERNNASGLLVCFIHKGK